MHSKEHISQLEKIFGYTIDPLCTETLSGTRSVTVNYDPLNDQVIVSAYVPVGSYTGFGWGATMTNTEMVIFSGGDSVATSSISYYLSESESTPTLDSTLDSCYTN